MPTPKDNYVIFTILGKAESEEQKIFRWQQWKDVSLILDELLSEFGKTPFYSSCDVQFEIPLKPLKSDPPEIKRVTGKKVPLGRLSWTPEHNMKWSQKLDEQLEHPVIFLGAVIVSSKETPPLVQVVIQNLFSSEIYNQVVSIAVQESFFDKKDFEYWQNLITKLSRRTTAVRVGKTRRPWCLDLGVDSNGFQSYHSIGGVSLAGLARTLDLDERHQQWDYLELMP